LLARTTKKVHPNRRSHRPANHINPHARFAHKGGWHDLSSVHCLNTSRSHVASSDTRSSSSSCRAPSS
jgi:hypothetical protein